MSLQRYPLRLDRLGQFPTLPRFLRSPIHAQLLLTSDHQTLLLLSRLLRRRRTTSIMIFPSNRITCEIEAFSTRCFEVSELTSLNPFAYFALNLLNRRENTTSQPIIVVVVLLLLQLFFFGGCCSFLDHHSFSLAALHHYRHAAVIVVVASCFLVIGQSDEGVLLWLWLLLLRLFRGHGFCRCIKSVKRA